MEIFKMFGTIFLKDEASDKLDDIDRNGRNLTSSLGSVAKFAGKASVALGAIASASAGAVATSAPLVALAGGLSASFASAGLAVGAYGAVAGSVLTGVFEKSEEIAKLEENLANADSAKERIKAQQELKKAMEGVSDAQKFAMEELNNFKSFWGGFTKQFETPILNSFGLGLSIIQGVMTGLAPTISAVSEVINNLLETMEQDISNGGLKGFFDWMETNGAESLNNFLTIAGNVFNGLFGMIQAFTPLGASMEEGIVRLTEKFATWANSLSENPAFQNFIEYAKANTPILLEVLGNLWTIITDVVTALAPLGTVVLDILTNVTDKIIEMSPMFTEIIGYVTDFANIIVTNWTPIENIIVGIGSAVGAFLLIMKGLQIIGVINALMVGLRTGTLLATLAQWGFNTALLANPITWIVALIALLIGIGILLYKNWDVIKAKTLELWSAMKEKWQQIKETIKSKIEEIKNNIKEKWQQIKSDTQAKVEELKNTAKQKFTDMVNAIRDKANEIKDKVKSGWDKAKSFLESIDLGSIGKNIIQGLINGIGSMAGAISSKVSELASLVPDGLSKFLNMHSPSKLTEKLGVYTGEGFEIGLDKSKKGIETASRSIASAPATALASSGSSGSSSDSLLQSVKTMLENFKVDLHMNAELVGQGVAPSVSNRQGETVARKRFFTGGDKK